jgi:cell division septum initiation protein DivIVA
MNSTVNEALAAIRQLVEQAKGVPMSSNVKVPRAELLGLIQRAEAAASTVVPTEPTPAGPDRVPEAEQADAILADARAEADRILAQGREEAAGLVQESEITRAANEEAEALRLESQTWVDNHLAEFEAGLQRTLEQVETLRERLAARSRDDDPA